MATGLWIIVGMLIAVFATVAAVVARTITRRQSELGTAVRDELRQGREDSSKASRELREELANGLSRAHEQLASTLLTTSGFQKAEIESVSGHIRDLAGTTTTALERSRETIDTRLGGFQEVVGARLDEIRRTADEKLTSAIDTGQKSMLETLSEMGRLQREQLETMSGQIREI